MLNPKLNKKIKRKLVMLSVLFAPILLGGCFESSSSQDVTDSGIYFPIDSVDYSAVTIDSAATNLPAGARVLASQCAQCHGTFGVAVASWPDLYGSGAVGTAMTDYQDLSYVDNMMHLHALAYTDAEVDLLKNYYSKISYTPTGGQ